MPHQTSALTMQAQPTLCRSHMTATMSATQSALWVGTIISAGTGSLTEQVCCHRTTEHGLCATAGAITTQWAVISGFHMRISTFSAISIPRISQLTRWRRLPTIWHCCRMNATVLHTALIMLTATTLHSSIALILAKTAVHLIRCFLKQRATVRIMRFTTFP